MQPSQPYLVTATNKSHPAAWGERRVQGGGPTRPRPSLAEQTSRRGMRAGVARSPHPRVVPPDQEKSSNVLQQRREQRGRVWPPWGGAAREREQRGNLPEHRVRAACVSQPLRAAGPARLALFLVVARASVPYRGGLDVVGAGRAVGPARECMCVCACVRARARARGCEADCQQQAKLTRWRAGRGALDLAPSWVHVSGS